MTISIGRLARKNISSMEKFREYSLQEFFISFPKLNCIGLGNANFIGVYINDADDACKNVVMTEDNLYFNSDGQWCDVIINEIEQVDGEEDKDSATKLFLTLSDGSRKTLIITGSDGRFRDVFKFHRFLLKAIRLNH